MSLEFEKIEIKNFLSFGNVPQTIWLNKKEFQLVIGLNKDKGESSANRSGVGKSSILNAIHFALFGQSVGNRINLPKLVNAINTKQCEVKLWFKKDNIEYIIHRGRSPQFLKFYINDTELQDTAQGNNKDTQVEIERILGFSSDIFTQIIALSPVVDSFLDQPLQKQRVIIESILGVNQLTEKADKLKEIIKEHKQFIKNEQFIIDRLKATNDATISSFNAQKQKIQEEYDKWNINNQNVIVGLKNSLKTLSEIDIEKEKKNFELMKEYNRINDSNEKKKKALMEIISDIQNHQARIATIQTTIDKLSAVNIDEEEQIFKYNIELKAQEDKYKNELLEHKQNQTKYKSLDKEFMSISNKMKQIEKDLTNVSKNICPTCGQEMNKEESAKLVSQKEAELAELKEQQHKIDLEMIELNYTLSQFKEKTFEYKNGYYSDYQEMVQHKFNLNKVKEELARYNQEMIELLAKAQSEEYKPETQIEKPVLKYKTEGEIVKHNLLVEQYTNELNKLESSDNINPYKFQLDNLANPPLNEIDESKIVETEKLLGHEEILLKLLSNPDSYIRKYIIDTNLAYLNERIKFYLAKMGSLHTVVFNNDMTTTITKNGIEYGYISTGEMSGASFALTLAFRDIWESLNFPVNMFYIDEVLDRSGLDTQGIEYMVSLLKSYTEKNKKNTMLVSHREELINSTDDIFTVVMENGFTNVEDN